MLFLVIHFSESEFDLIKPMQADKVRSTKLQDSIDACKFKSFPVLGINFLCSSKI